MMKICIILPPFFFNPDSQGFNEMLASEMIAVCESSADVSVCKEFPQNEADIFISNLLSYQMINELEAKLLKVATSDKVLTVSQDIKDSLRANIFKNMLVNLV